MWGELRYFVGARLGRSHCALCDITHGLVRDATTGRRREPACGAPFDTFHRDDQPDPIRAATADTAPAVVAETADGVVLLLGPSELDGCAGAPERLVAAIDAAVQRAGLDCGRQAQLVDEVVAQQRAHERRRCPSR